ncbi:hypothetical protein [Methylomarinum vadi]|uniref:hypothetical protein n=1 Tax=Methylomarinum vadi TaxID=438855 RepID=UPI0004DF9558|nr:hypothetical protein [Methylomarinum vadi]
MNWNLIKLLLSVCAVLLLVLLLEWWLAGVSDRQRNDEPRPTQGADLQLELPEIKPPAMAAEMYADMVERPLFIEGRRPVVEEDEEESVQEVDSVDDLELIGIYTDDNRLMALFSKKGRDKKFLKKAQGEDIGNWLLQEVHADSVVLDKDGKRQTLLLRKPKLQPLVAPAARVPPAAARLKQNSAQEGAEARARAQFEAQQQDEEEQAEQREQDEMRAREAAAARAKRR